MKAFTGWKGHPRFTLRVFCLLGAVGLAIWAGIHQPGRATAETVSPSYLEHVQPVFQASCVACHNSTARISGLVLENYEGLLKGGAHGPAILPGKSSESRLILMLEGNVKPQMPFGGQPLSAADIAAIKGWIDAGAKAPPAGAASITPSPRPAVPDIRPQVPVVSPVSSLAFAPNGGVLAVGGYREVRLVEAATGKVLTTLSDHADMVRALAFSPDGMRLAAAGGLPARSGEVKIWDVGTRQALHTLVGHQDCIYSVAISPDGRLVASSSYDKLILLWDLETGKELRTLKDHIDAVFAVTFSRNGKWLASGAGDRTVKIWDVATGQRLFTLSEPLDGITTVGFSPSGTQLAAAGLDKMIRTWDLTEKGGSLAQSAFAHEDAILQVMYSPDGKTIVSTSADRTIRLWDSATLAPVAVLEAQPDWVQAMSISPDGKSLAAGRYDGTVSIYDLGTHQRVLGPLRAFETYTPAKETAERQTAAR